MLYADNATGFSLISTVRMTVHNRLHSLQNSMSRSDEPAPFSAGYSTRTQPPGIARGWEAWRLQGNREESCADLRFSQGCACSIPVDAALHTCLPMKRVLLPDCMPSSRARKHATTNTGRLAQQSLEVTFPHGPLLEATIPASSRVCVIHER
jgi:hypothetical protein